MSETPMMKQFLGFKRQYPDKIVLFRMGDFFETFGEDAKITSKVLNITLTKRDKTKDATLLAGFPHKAIDQYLPKLVKGGYCVVVVDQLEDPKLAKGIVKRGVTRIVTPGTLDGEQASSVKDSYLAAIYHDKKETSISLCDISTGKFLLISDPSQKDLIKHIISSYSPAEILLLEGEEGVNIGNLPVQFVDKSLRNREYSAELIKKFYEIKNVNSLDIKEGSEDLVSVAMIIKYIEETQLMDPSHIMKPRRVKLNKRMVLDSFTINNLELVANSYTGEIENSLFSVIDRTETPMGRRLLYFWILNPLIEKKEIDERLNLVEKFTGNRNILEGIRERLGEINDIERIVGKIGLGRVNARDMKALQDSLENVLTVLNILKKDFNVSYKEIDTEVIKGLIEKIDKTIKEDPPTTIMEGGIIKEGFNKEVDELRSLTGDSKSWIKDFEKEEKERTGIPSLKVSSNKVFGYYIEVTRTHQEKVPERYIRKQTLVNSERYITEELKEKESIILNAQERIFGLEYEIFVNFRDTFIPFLQQLQEVSATVARIDVLSGFAKIALESDYIRPEIYEIGEKDGVINIVNGRHPLVESISGEEFISNDTYLDLKNSNMAILTGPNMSGKSTYIRQVATIVLLAQIGCFVPATSAQISLVDRIFTRVGASDDLSRGRSTFMVEMDEAANIINNATKYSLIVLDEIGRGTSTYDGVSIAWALSEYLIKELKARTLFATHYHELLKLSEKFPESVKNYNVLVEEDIEEGTVIFLRKIVEGGTDRSYGIYVAKMAGLPNKVIKRANEILESFEQKNMFTKSSDVREATIEKVGSRKGQIKENGFQYPLFTAKESEVEREIQDLDVDNLTPIEALNKISEWKKKI
ncbi:MAG TPA: DNA mismatch repair protein MutS [Candidatus Dojkabacteria bacterium]|nr:DNA mismatch repair protein MutS [Candidatus Dojkabacteria bacterium]